MKQAPSSILMIRPDHFGFNHETAASNAFQKSDLLCDKHKVLHAALHEFESFVALLKNHGVDVRVFPSPDKVEAPDAVFPNNWISFHEDGRVILYPMLTENRRIERRPEIVEDLTKSFLINNIIDLSKEEKQGRILEGTGSIVFDHVHQVAYANKSPRTNRQLFYDVCALLDYEGIFFTAVDEKGKDIYHTNVMMTIGDGFAIICTECIDKVDRDSVMNNLLASGLEIIEINCHQMNNFAGNMIQLQSNAGENLLVMSQNAFEVLSEDQKNRLNRYAQLIHADIHTIESIGGGSVRCMIAGIHSLPHH